jgi:hypothetical protein
MKNNYFLLIVVLTLNLVCCKDTTDSINSSDKNKNDVQYVGTTLGGCNNKRQIGKTLNKVASDTVIVTTKNDTTTISVNLYYLCEWRFDNDYSFSSDTLYLTIRDTCTGNCGAWCDCNYIFDYRFVNISQKGIKYNARFKSLRNDSRVIGEGIIE